MSRIRSRSAGRSQLEVTDEDLWGRSRRGDDVAFGRLFDRHADALFRYCVVRLRSRESAQDVVSYVFAEAWRQRHRIELQAGSLRPWLFSVARNRTGRVQAQLIKRADRSLGETVVVLDDHADRVVDRVDAQRLCADVLAAIDVLPTAAREVLVLSVWGGLTYEQIAAELNIEIGTVKSRLNRARQRLASVVDPQRRSSSSEASRGGEIITLFTSEDRP